MIQFHIEIHFRKLLRSVGYLETFGNDKRKHFLKACSSLQKKKIVFHQTVKQPVLMLQ